MATRKRLDPIDGWHHITNHKVEGSGDLFLVADDCWLMLRILVAAAATHHVRIVSFCLMGNHYHLVVHCPNGGVSAFMHQVDGVYAELFNKRHGRRGRLFAANFHNVLIESDGQLLFTTRYVDRNPLELGIDIRTYPWSSYSYFAYPETATSIVPLSTELPLKLAGGPSAYRHFVESDQAHDGFPMSEGIRRVHATPAVAVEHRLEELHNICVRLASRLDATAAGRRRIARSAATLIAQESGLAISAEIRHFFDYRTESAYTSAVYRAKISTTTDASFGALVQHARPRWTQSTTRRAS